MLPLPKGKKHPPPTGYTGANGITADEATVESWADQFPTGNIGLRLAEVSREHLPPGLPPTYNGEVVDGWELVGIDIDNYKGRNGDQDKNGYERYRELAEELGEDLPATIGSSARWVTEPLSGTWYFLVPKGYRYKDGPKHLDYLWRGHRYSVVWPSIHPEGMRYEYRLGSPGEGAATAVRIDGVPPLTSLAVLPEAWFRHFLADGPDTGEYTLGDMGLDAVTEWADVTFNDCQGEPCAQMREVVEKRKAELDESDSHTPLNDVLWELAQLAREGHTGYHTATQEYLTHWIAVSQPKRDLVEMQGEITRSLEGAMGKTKARMDSDGSDGVPRDVCDRLDGWAANLAQKAGNLPSPNAPRAVARKIKEHYEQQRKNLAWWNGVWFRWATTYYEQMDDDDLFDELSNWLETATYTHTTQTASTEVAWNPGPAKVKAVIEMLRGLVRLPRDIKANQWIDGRDVPVVPCLNGLVRLGDRKVLDHTPDFFNIFCVPCDYDRAATSPTLERFNRDAYGDDTDMRKLTQQFGGYVLSGRTDLHKSLMWIGGTRCGKGTYVRMLKRLLGAEAYLGISSNHLGASFSMESMIGKSLVVFPDERQMSAPAGKHLVQFVLQATGDDDMTIGRKYQRDWTGQPFMRIVYLTNEQPTLPDASGAALGRFLIVDSGTRSWKGNEDPSVETGLATELSGVLNYYLKGLDELNANGGRFPEPESAQDVTDDIDHSSNRVRGFLQSGRLVLKNGNEIRTSEFLLMYKDWDRAINGAVDRDVTPEWLGRQVRSAMRDIAPDVKFKRKQIMVCGDRPYIYEGIGINPEWRPEVADFQQKWKDQQG